MRGRPGFALVTALLLALARIDAAAFDVVEVSRSSDPRVIQGAKTPVKAEVRVLGPWQVQLTSQGGAGSVDHLVWENDVPIPFSLVWDGDVAHLSVGSIALAHDPNKNVSFGAI